jgi:carbon monoxide dehydrogenase subunit G
VKIFGSYALPVAREHAYQMLQDPVILAQAIPGCESLDKIGVDEYRMKMKVLLAALSGQFEGKVRITEQSAPSSFRLMVEGTGRIGFLKGDGLLKLSAGESGNGSTVVSYEGDAQVGGTMAAVGQRLMEGTAKMMIKKFFDKLSSLTQSGKSNG